MKTEQEVKDLLANAEKRLKSEDFGSYTEWDKVRKIEAEISAYKKVLEIKEVIFNPYK